jgi:solute carrier family 36 (proton-coupled amino acid transporter)
MKDLLMLATGCSWDPPEWAFIFFQILVYIPLAWVRRIKNFGFTALIADVFILIGLCYILSFDVITIAHGGLQPVPYINLKSFSLFIGTAMFSFEGICLMLPIVQSMEKPEKFSGVLTKCIATVAVTFIVIGSLGYISLGSFNLLRKHSQGQCVL